MPRIPSSTPSDWKDRLGLPPCDPRLPEAALAYRRENGLTDERSLGTINVTAWLYKDAQGRQGVQVNPNIPIKQLRSMAPSTRTSRSVSTRSSWPQNGSERSPIYTFWRFL